MSLATFFAQASIGQGPVPIEREPMHRPKFENDKVRVFDVLVPPGKASLFHTHIYDGVSVRISNMVLTEEFENGQKATIEIKYGEAAFGARPSPLTHRVVNNDRSDFRNIFIELLSLARSRTPASIPPVLDGRSVLVDNDRIRATRRVLKPGEYTSVHTHTTDGLSVILYDGKVEITSGGKSATVQTKAGDVAWQAAGTTHMIKNIGTSVFEVVDIELK
jgi:quercetin dioxygenase-like cupin family protein